MPTPFSPRTGAWMLASLTLALVLSSGCSTRTDTPTVSESTVTYPAKNGAGVEAQIVFCDRSPSKKTGELRGVTDEFTADEDAKVYAFVDLAHVETARRPLELHLVWIGPDDETIYKKRIEHTPEGSPDALRSSISLPPDRRAPGRYLLRVYCFRELIAERSFQVRHRA